MSSPLPNEVFDTLFLNARTHNGWLPQEVPESLLLRLYDTLRMGPTLANSTPARFVFVRSKEAKEKLKPHLSAGNVDKTMAAPVTVIVAHDLEFYESWPRLFPHADMKKSYAGKTEALRKVSEEQSWLQGGYFILAARALGLDCGPMAGFNNAGVDEVFFKGSSWRSTFLCNLGYGDVSKLYPRGSRLSFEEACRVE